MSIVENEVEKIGRRGIDVLACESQNSLDNYLSPNRLEILRKLYPYLVGCSINNKVFFSLVLCWRDYKNQYIEKCLRGRSGGELPPADVYFLR